VTAMSLSQQFGSKTTEGELQRMKPIRIFLPSMALFFAAGILGQAQTQPPKPQHLAARVVDPKASWLSVGDQHGESEYAKRTEPNHATTDPRTMLFEKYNKASTYEEIGPLLSGLLAKQFAALASLDRKQFLQVVNNQQLISYSPRFVDIDDKTSFLVVDNAKSKSGQNVTGWVYLLSKNAVGDWTLANKFTADSIIKTLWMEKFAPERFNQPTVCSVDGKQIRAQSVLAFRENDTIKISLYPFPLSQADLDYWREVSGIPVDPNSSDNSHFPKYKGPMCLLTIKLDKNDQVTLVNIGFEDHSGGVARSTVWQVPKSAISKLQFGRSRIALETSGNVGATIDGISWNMKFDSPLWERGL
jgi:hypothetical protein